MFTPSAEGVANVSDKASVGHRVSRRGLLTAGVTGGALLVLPSRAWAQDATTRGTVQEPCYHCVDPAAERDLTAAQIGAGHDRVSVLATTRRSKIGETRLHYEPTGARTTFTFESTFYDQILAWRDNLSTHVPSSWNGPPTRLDTYGVYVDKPGMHGQGRAIDIARVTFTAADGTTRNMNCRYDQWRNWGNLDRWRKRYWALSASLHLRFRHVLTYLYNAEHHNHIHVDNAVYGWKSGAQFNSGSSAQVQHVQACCRYLFGYSTTIDGIWGPQTLSHSTAVLRRYGVSSGTIQSSGARWRQFNFASMRQGSGRESY